MVFGFEELGKVADVFLLGGSVEAPDMIVVLLTALTLIGYASLMAKWLASKNYQKSLKFWGGIPLLDRVFLSLGVGVASLVASVTFIMVITVLVNFFATLENYLFSGGTQMLFVAFAYSVFYFLFFERKNDHITAIKAFVRATAVWVGIGLVLFIWLSLLSSAIGREFFGFSSDPLSIMDWIMFVLLPLYPILFLVIRGRKKKQSKEQ